MVRHNNQLPHNLPQLQNLIKRDPESYKEEFLHQLKNFESTLAIFCLSPERYDKDLDALSMFLAQVAQCYQDEMQTFPQTLIDILEKHNTVLDNNMRMAFCKTLILLRNKNLLGPTVLLKLFFELLRSQDKNLRTFLKTHIINDIKNVNALHKNAKVNTTLQNFMFTMLKDNNARAAKMSLDIMISLYNKNVWNDAKTVNVIATSCLVKHPKIMATGLKFFLGTDDDDKKKDSDDSDSDDEPNIKEVMMANKVNKKTKKREKQLKKAKQIYVKSKKKKSQAPQYNFSALHLIYDPQSFAEKLFDQLKKSDWFEIKIMTLDVISRLIGLHQLFILNFYPYLQRLLQPRQREVTKLLLFIAQASHELVPPETLGSVLRTLVDNFITERNSTDVIAIGLNAVREICSRCPLAMTEDLLGDLAQYRNYKEKSVMMAARSLVSLYRIIMPEMLHKKDRGRPTEATMALDTLKYGQSVAKSFVPGAEVILDKEKSDSESDEEEENEDSDDDEWVDVSHSEDEEEKEKIEEDVNESEEAKDVEQEDEEKTKDSETKSDVSTTSKKSLKRKSEKPLTKQQKKKRRLENKLKQKEEKKEEYTAESREKATVVSMNRLLSDKDFQKIDMAMAKKQVTFANRGLKRSLEEEKNRSELIKLSDIENIHKKRKHDKQARIESIKRGQEDKEKFGYKDGRQNENCSKTNREKKKTKAYQMIKHKIHNKVKRSFKDKQRALRNHLLNQKKMK